MEQEQITSYAIAGLIVARALIKYLGRSNDRYNDAISRLRLVIEDLNDGTFLSTPEFWQSLESQLTPETQREIQKLLSRYI